MRPSFTSAYLSDCLNVLPKTSQSHSESLIYPTNLKIFPHFFLGNITSSPILLCPVNFKFSSSLFFNNINVSLSCHSHLACIAELVFQQTQLSATLTHPSLLPKLTSYNQIRSIPYSSPTNELSIAFKVRVINAIYKGPYCSSLPLVL